MEGRGKTTPIVVNVLKPRRSIELRIDQHPRSKARSARFERNYRAHLKTCVAGTQNKNRSRFKGRETPQDAPERQNSYYQCMFQVVGLVVVMRILKPTTSLANCNER